MLTTIVNGVKSKNFINPFHFFISMKFFKKGDLNIRYLVLMILGLMVLVIIAIIFTRSSTTFIEKIKEIWVQITAAQPDLTELTKK